MGERAGREERIRAVKILCGQERVLVIRTHERIRSVGKKIKYTHNADCMFGMALHVSCCNYFLLSILIVHRDTCISNLPLANASYSSPLPNSSLAEVS